MRQSGMPLDKRCTFGTLNRCSGRDNCHGKQDGNDKGNHGL